MHWICLATASEAGAFGTWWHAEATRIAMEAHGFSSDARLLAQITNYLVDYHSVAGDLYTGLKEGVAELLPGISGEYRVDVAGLRRLHFDSLTSTKQIEYQWKTLEANTRAALQRYAGDTSVRPGFRPIVLITIVGASLHAVQDFYSHSNWVDLLSADPSNAGRPIPTWHEVPPARRQKLHLVTGTYP